MKNCMLSLYYKHKIRTINSEIGLIKDYYIDYCNKNNKTFEFDQFLDNTVKNKRSEIFKIKRKLHKIIKK
jgi:hypothetical protein